ncbi:MAG TPA: ABC-F family ATP-binding cassette domain-containing protein [Patescibacteria group bacterium]
MINLKITKLEKHYNQPLLDNVTLSHTGEGIIALIGDNGSGKSTLLKILAGLEEQDGGKIEWSWEPRIGYLTQEIESLPTLSGGQKKLAILADLIYSNQYDVLLLDEPDNHLDIENKEWLANALSTFNGLVIMISHDRHLLKKITTRTWLVEDREVRTYPFGYEKFIKEYEKERTDQEHLFHVQDKEHKRLKELVDRFKSRASSGPKMAKYYHALEKRLARFESEMIRDPKSRDVKIELSTHVSGKQIKNKLAIMVREMSFAYQDNLVFENAELFIEVGEKVALLSPNGTGKSTLIKLILGQLEPQVGVAKTGENLKVGYYSQEHLETLPGNVSPIECFTGRFPIADYEAAAVLRKFYFGKQTMKSKVNTLSGGQKSRLQLALFLYTNPDILILDEPTNHLDLKSVAALEDFLENYEGTVLLISHDHDLLRNVCDLVYEIKSKKIRLRTSELSTY